VLENREKIARIFWHTRTPATKSSCC